MRVSIFLLAAAMYSTIGRAETSDLTSLNFLIGGIGGLNFEATKIGSPPTGWTINADQNGRTQYLWEATSEAKKPFWEAPMDLKKYHDHVSTRKGVDGQLIEASGQRVLAKGSQNWTASLDHGRITALTRCQHDGDLGSQCVTATKQACAGLSDVLKKWKGQKNSQEIYEKCAEFFTDLASVYSDKERGIAKSLYPSLDPLLDPKAKTRPLAFANLQQLCSQIGFADAKENEKSKAPEAAR